MSRWLRNLQGQLTELASEVLTEATEEVADPESELQVEKRRSADLNSRLQALTIENDLLKARVTETDEQLTSAQLHLDALNNQYRSVVESRDNELRRLQAQLSKNHESLALDDTDYDVRQLKDQLKQLRAEVVHWKAVVNENDDMVDLRQQLAAITDKHQAELSSLQIAHADAIRTIRSQYESRMPRKQEVDDGAEWNTDWGGDSDVHDETIIDNRHRIDVATSVHDLAADDDNVHRKVDELQMQVTNLNEQLEQLDNEHKTIIDELHRTLQQSRSRCDDAERQLAEKQLENENNEQMATKLRRENEELASAYNDLNDAFEKHKAEYGSVLTSNRDLNIRIESLKADLIEYEEKYERCKVDNSDTAMQLERLTNEFERLKYGLESARTSASVSGDIRLSEEVKRLQSELIVSQEARDKLIIDLSEFNGAIAKIDGELDSLRTANHELADENRQLRVSIGDLTNLKDIFEDTEMELVELRTRAKQFQVAQLKSEMQLREELQEALEDKQRMRQTHIDQLESVQKQIDEYRARVDAAESALVRYRAVVGDDAASMVEQTIKEKKTSSSGGASDAGDSNGWDKVGEWDHDGNTSASKCSVDERPINQIELQMREALAAVTEKTDECEELNTRLMNKSQELQERDEMLQQAFTELKGLECQLAESRERESNLRSNVQRLTIETAHKDEELQTIRNNLESSQSAQTELTLQLQSCINEHRLAIERLEAERDQRYREDDDNAHSIADGQLQLRIDTLTQRLDTVTGQLNTVTQQLADVTDERNAVIEQLNAVTEQLDTVNRQLDDITEQRNAVTEQLNAVNRQWEDVSAQRNTVTEQLNIVTKQLGDVTDERNAVIEQLNIVTEQLDTVHLQWEDVTEQRNTVTEQLNAENRQWEDVSEQRNTVAEQLNIVTKQLGDVTDQRNAVIEQLNIVTEQLNAVNRQWEDVTEQRNTVTEQLTIVSDQRDQVTNAKIELEQRLDHLQAKFDSNRRQFDEQIEQLQSDIEHRQQVIDTQNSELARLSALLSAQTSTSTDADARIAEAIAARDQLVTLVQQKHDESVRYHAQLQQAIVDREAIEQRMNHISRDMQSRYEEEKRIITDRLHNADEECARANRELDRLRQHLLQMEENYTRDAVAAEERETELRMRIRRLETQTETTSLTAQHSHNQYEGQIDDLQIQLESLAGQRDSALLQLDDCQHRLAETNRALSSLQHVLSEMQRDAESETSTEIIRMKSELDRYKTMNQELEMKLKRLNAVESERNIEQQRAADELAALRASLAERDVELRLVEQRLAHAERNNGAQLASTSNRQKSTPVDTEILRNLFLNYFTAPNDKKRDVALLLASVLGCSSEEISRIESGRPIFGRNRGGSSALSITEQFVVFLENESTATPTTPKFSPLPVEQHSPSKSTGGVGAGQMKLASFDLPSYGQSSSSDTLKKMLNE